MTRFPEAVGPSIADHWLNVPYGDFAELCASEGSDRSSSLLCTKKKQDLAYAANGVISTVNPRF